MSLLARHGMGGLRSWYVPTILAQLGDLSSTHKLIKVERAHNIPFLHIERINTPGFGTWGLAMNIFQPGFDFSMLAFIPGNADRKFAGMKRNSNPVLSPYNGNGYWADQHESNWQIKDEDGGGYNGSGGFPFYILAVMKNNELKFYQGNNSSDFRQFSSGWTLRYTDPSDWSTATTIRTHMGISIDAGGDNYIRSSFIDKAVI